MQFVTHSRLNVFIRYYPNVTDSMLSDDAQLLRLGSRADVKEVAAVNPSCSYSCCTRRRERGRVRESEGDQISREEAPS